MSTFNVNPELKTMPIYLKVWTQSSLTSPRNMSAANLRHPGPMLVHEDLLWLNTMEAIEITYIQHTLKARYRSRHAVTISHQHTESHQYTLHSHDSQFLIDNSNRLIKSSTYTVCWKGMVITHHPVEHLD